MTILQTGIKVAKLAAVLAEPVAQNLAAFLADDLVTVDVNDYKVALSPVSPDNHKSGLVAVDLEAVAAIERGEDANVSLDVTDDSEII